jgi:ABC-2 type transport system permease protein
MTAPSQPYGPPAGIAPYAPPPGLAPAARRARRPATFADSLRAEWIKLRTLRSTWITLLVAVVLAVGIGALISWGASSHYDTDLSDRRTWDPTSVSFDGLAFAQLAFAVLGVLVVAGEYSSGMIRTSLAAVPRRARWFGTKAVVYTAVTLVIGEVIAFVAFFLGQAIIGHWAPNAALGDPGVLRAVIGGGLYLAGIGLLAVAVGALVRNSAGGIAIMVALIFVLPLVSNALPASWRNPVQQYWPTGAGSQVFTVVRSAHTLSAWPGFGVFLAFIAVVVAVAMVLLEHRDA